MAKYQPKFKVTDERSVLFGLPEAAVQAEFTKLVLDSASYIVFRKCDIKLDVFEEMGAFENISHFNSTEIFMALGYHATAIAKPREYFAESSSFFHLCGRFPIFQ